MFLCLEDVYKDVFVRINNMDVDTTDPLLHNSQAVMYNFIYSVSLKCKIKK